MQRQTTGQAVAYTSEDIARTLDDYQRHYRMSNETFRSLWRARQLDHGDFELSRWALLLDAHERAQSVERLGS